MVAYTYQLIIHKRQMIALNCLVSTFLQCNKRGQIQGVQYSTLAAECAKTGSNNHDRGSDKRFQILLAGDGVSALFHVPVWDINIW